MRRVAIVLSILAVLGGSCSSGSPRPVLVGAVYPTSGSQGPGGIEEFHGVELATDMVNRAGGIDGRPVQLRAIDVPSADVAPEAIARLHRDGVGIVLGSYGSTISLPAAQTAARLGMLFWETGAVGYMSAIGRGSLVFRVAPSGLILGASAIDFVVQRLAPMLHRSTSSLRFAVAYADDVYGSEVARGAMQRLNHLHLRLVSNLSYDPRHLSAAGLVHRVARARPDVVFVSAYLDDGVAIRREIVRQHLPLVANIGTSSSYCMPAFGARLGRDAVGVFASDKPAAEYINLRGLTPQARNLTSRAADEYEDQFGEEMSAPALAGFSAAWALLHHVMPKAAQLSPDAVAAAARTIRLPMGSLPNGSGLAFGPPGTAQAGWNVRAASVIWQWVSVGYEAVVWPPRLATTQVRLPTS